MQVSCNPITSNFSHVLPETVLASLIHLENKKRIPSCSHPCNNLSWRGKNWVSVEDKKLKANRAGPGKLPQVVSNLVKVRKKAIRVSFLALTYDPPDLFFCAILPDSNLPGGQIRSVTRYHQLVLLTRPFSLNF